MDKQLLSILVCPLCKGALTYHAEQQELWCTQSRLAYPIKDGIPMMLTSEARALSDAECAA